MTSRTRDLSHRIETVAYSVLQVSRSEYSNLLWIHQFNHTWLEHHRDFIEPYLDAIDADDYARAAKRFKALQMYVRLSRASD